MEERITVEMTEACLETLILSLRLIDSVDKALESTDKAVKAECWKDIDMLKAVISEIQQAIKFLRAYIPAKRKRIRYKLILRRRKCDGVPKSE